MGVTGVALARGRKPRDLVGVGNQGSGLGEPARSASRPPCAHIPRPVEHQIGLAAVVGHSKERQRRNYIGGDADKGR